MYDYAKKTTVAILKIIGYYREGEIAYIVICQHTNISMKRISEILDYEREQDSENDQCYQELEKVAGDIVRMK